MQRYRADKLHRGRSLVALGNAVVVSLQQRDLDGDRKMSSHDYAPAGYFIFIPSAASRIAARGLATRKRYESFASTVRRARDIYSNVRSIAWVEIELSQ